MVTTRGVFSLEDEYFVSPGDTYQYHPTLQCVRRGTAAQKIKDHCQVVDKKMEL
jgi:hypothetical protein